LLRRRIGYVIQQVGLFPHMTVGENVQVTEEIAGWSRARMAGRGGGVFRLGGLPPGGYRDRLPRQLSGGEAERVGPGPGLAPRPAILLMDEPFGALDAITRSRMQEELLRIQSGVRKTILFVSHDVEEAFRLGQQIAVLSEGRLVQVGTPIDLLARPANALVRALVGADSILRHLQYLPVTAALEPNGAGQERDAGPSNATLLQAMLRLIETNAPALAVYDAQTRSAIGRVTLSSINREIVTARLDSARTPSSAGAVGNA